MLISIEHNIIIVKFNCRFYSINAIIAANTRFSNQFSTEVLFAILNIGTSLYHKVKLTPKGGLNLRDVYSYVNEALLYQDEDSGVLKLLN